MTCDHPRCSCEATHRCVLCKGIVCGRHALLHILSKPLHPETAGVLPPRPGVNTAADARRGVLPPAREGADRDVVPAVAVS